MIQPINTLLYCKFRILNHCETNSPISSTQNRSSAKSIKFSKVDELYTTKNQITIYYKNTFIIYDRAHKITEV